MFNLYTKLMIMRCAISLVLIEIVFMSKGDDQAKINVVGKLGGET